MRAALALLFGLIFLAGACIAFRREKVPFDRRVGGARSKHEAPGWYWSMLLLYGAGGLGLVSWGLWRLMQPSP